MDLSCKCETRGVIIPESFAKYTCATKMAERRKTCGTTINTAQPAKPPQRKIKLLYVTGNCARAVGVHTFPNPKIL